MLDDEKSAKIVAMTLYNYEQEQIFKSGGIALPKVNTIEEFDALLEALSSFKTANKKFSDVSKSSGITYEIPERYK